MDLFEYQARDMFAKHGVPVLPAQVAGTPAEAAEAARQVGTASDGITVVKAQVKTGGRGKAGGVRLARTPGEAQDHAQAILGMDINGHAVHTVMVAQGADIAREFYFSILLDRAERSLLAMCSAQGGMEIERLAAEHPEALARIHVDPLTGIDEAKAREIVDAAGFDEADKPALAAVIRSLWQVYHDEDATLVEVNPLVKTRNGAIVALDGKVTLDDNARFRHPGHAGLVHLASEDPLELLAREKHLNYVKLDGNVGVIGNGAGLVMSTLDVVAYAGQEHAGADGRYPHPANFLDIGGGANAQVMAAGLDIIFSDPQVKAVLVNVFGGITACDEVADGIVRAYDIIAGHGNEPKPLVVRLDGNNAALGREILDRARLPLLEQAGTMDGAAARVAELAARAN